MENKMRNPMKAPVLACGLMVVGSILAHWGCGSDPQGGNLPQAEQTLLLPSAPVGITSPASSYARYRRPEFPQTQQYFQWWWFWVKDLAHERHLSVSYAVLDSAALPQNRRAEVAFGSFDAAADTALFQIKRAPLSGLQVANDFDVTITPEGGTPSTITVIDDDTYRIQGAIPGADPTVILGGNRQGAPLTTSIPVRWDLTVHRIYGWYGFDFAETMLRLAKAVDWNGFAHTSEVEGTITVGDEVITLARGSQARAYVETGFGVNLPKGYTYEDATQYPWSWFAVGRPGEAGQTDLSIVAAVTRTRLPGLGIVEGKVADIRLDAATAIQVSCGAPYSMGAICKTNDGKVKTFEVTRDDWAAFPDGAGQVPLYQRLVLETDHYLVELDFYSELARTVRYPMTVEDYLISNFEALGVDAHAVVTHRWTTASYYWWDIFKKFPHDVLDHSEVAADFWSTNTGLEFAYRTD
jgi:hypothetical protein